MIHLGLVVYCWGMAEQNRLLVEGLAPGIARLRRQGLVQRLWFDRFDARGPHLLLSFGISQEVREDVARCLSRRLAGHFAAYPSSEGLSREQLEALHLGCRGTVQCAVDRQPGFGADHTHVFFDHGAADYPFWVGRGLAREAELWELLSASAQWVLGRLAAGDVHREAVGWVAAMDAALRRAGQPAAEYWRHHAATLHLGLRRRVESDEAGVLERLPGMVGKRNWSAFEGIWRSLRRSDSPYPLAEGLARVVVGSEGGTESPETGERRWARLREIDHFTLKQLGIPVALHLPMILFAWHRSRSLVSSS